MEKDRKPYLDYLKGIAASFVVIGHCITYYAQHYSYAHTPFWLSLLGVLVSSVHVPLFFLIAGYLCHPKPYRQHIMHKVFRILLPYFSFSILKLLYGFTIDSSLAHGSNLLEIIYDIFVLGGPYWFIYCMFIIYLLAPIGWLGQSENNEQKNRLLIIVLLVFYIFDVITQDFKIITFPNEWVIMGFHAKTPLFQLERVCIYFPYFIIGMLIQNNQEMAVIFLRRIKLGVIISLTIGALLIGCFVTIGVITKGFFFKCLIAFPLMLALYRTMLLVPGGVILYIPGKYSLHIMFFDSLFRVLLFAALANFTKLNAALIILISIADIVLSCMVSCILERLPLINFFLGLTNYYSYMGHDERKKD